MRTWKIAPKDSAVARYVECYWLLEKDQADCTHDFPKLNPDPAAHLILSNPRQNYSYKLETRTFSGSVNYLILPHSKTMIMDHSQSFLIFGIKFAVGALYSLQFSSVPNTQNIVVPVNFEEMFQLGTLSQKGLTSENSGQPEESRDYCDELLTQFFSRVDEDRHPDLVRKVLELLNSGIAGVT